MKITKSNCCDAPVLSIVEPVECICNAISAKTVMLIYKCTGCGQRCGTTEKEDEDTAVFQGGKT